MSQKPQPLQQSFRKFGQSSKTRLKAGSGARHIFSKCSGRADVLRRRPAAKLFLGKTVPPRRSSIEWLANCRKGKCLCAGPKFRLTRPDVIWFRRACSPSGLR